MAPRNPAVGGGPDRGAAGHLEAARRALLRRDSRAALLAARLAARAAAGAFHAATGVHPGMEGEPGAGSVEVFGHYRTLERAASRLEALPAMNLPMEEAGGYVRLAHRVVERLASLA